MLDLLRYFIKYLLNKNSNYLLLYINYLYLLHLKGFVQWINVGRENSSHAECIQTEILNRLNNQEQLITPPLIIDYEATRKKIRKL